MRKRGLAFERHRELGPRLSAGRAALVLLHGELTGSYRRDHTVLAMSVEAIKALDRLRAELENAAFAEHGPDRDGSVYFPNDGKGSS